MVSRARRATNRNPRGGVRSDRRSVRDLTGRFVRRLRRFWRAGRRKSSLKSGPKSRLLAAPTGFPIRELRLTSGRRRLDRTAPGGLRPPDVAQGVPQIAIVRTRPTGLRQVDVGDGGQLRLSGPIRHPDDNGGQDRHADPASHTGRSQNSWSRCHCDCQAAHKGRPYSPLAGRSPC